MHEDRPERPRGVSRWVPALTTVRRYRAAWLRDDLVAGLVVTALLVLSLSGHFLGVRAFRRLAGPRFSLVALALVVFAGLASLAAGLAGL